jgi:hypothetical protein
LAINYKKEVFMPVMIKELDNLQKFTKIADWVFLVKSKYILKICS